MRKGGEDSVGFIGWNSVFLFLGESSDVSKKYFHGIYFLLAKVVLIIKKVHEEHRTGKN